MACQLFQIGCADVLSLKSPQGGTLRCVHGVPQVLGGHQMALAF